MGLNSKHGKSKDICTGYDVTQDMKFKFELLDDNQMNKYEALLGLEFCSTKRMIRINGSCNLKVKDTIRIFGEQYSVTEIKSFFSSKGELEFKSYLDDCQGATIVALS